MCYQIQSLVSFLRMIPDERENVNGYPFVFYAEILFPDGNPGGKIGRNDENRFARKP